MYTYTITHSKAGATWGNGNSCIRLAITNEDTGETKVCDDFTYLEDDTQENLEYLFENDFGDFPPGNHTPALSDEYESAIMHILDE